MNAARRCATILTAAIFFVRGAIGAAPDAQPASPSGVGQSEIAEVVVTGHYEFLSVDTSGATNLPLPIEKVPQSISLVNSDFIKSADLKTLAEIAEYTPGALNAGSEEGFSTDIKLRGFASAQALDGLNVGVVAGTSFEPEYAVMDRLEVVKGPSSVIYGISSAGGLVNFVTKGATASTPTYVTAQAGSWNSFRVEGQIAGALNSSGTLQGIGIMVRDQGDSFMNDVSHYTSVAYGGVNWTPNDRLSAYLHAGYEQHIRTAFDGIPSEPDGSPGDLPRSFFIGSERDKLYTNAFYAVGDLTWHPLSSLDVGLKTNVRRLDTHGLAPYSYGLEPDGTIGIAMQEYQAFWGTDYGTGLSAVYHFDQLGLKNSFLSLSAIYQADCSCVLAGNATFGGAYTGPDPYDGVANVYDGQAAIEAAYNSATLQPPFPQANTWSRTRTVSAQTVIEVIDHLSVLGGASFSDPRITQDNGGISARFDPKNQISYRAAIMDEFLPGANVYVSYSQSFNPQAAVDVNNNVLPPLTGTQYEAGVKYRPPGNRILWSIAGFQIRQENQAQFVTNIDGIDRFEPIGEVTHRGVEFQALGSVTPQLQISAGYAYLDPKVTRDSDASIVGAHELFLPKNTADIFATYNMALTERQSLTYGGGLRYVGSEATAYDDSTKPIASYVLVDGNAGYSIDNWALQLNLHNLGNRRYYVNNYSTTFYGNTVGAPFHAAISLTRRF